VILLACVLHLGVRMCTIGNHGFDHDEAVTWGMTRSLKNVIPLAITDCHPPLYAILETLWTGLFGTSEAVFRSLSMVFSLLLFLLLAVCVCDAQPSNKTWAILAIALVFCMLPYDIYFSRYARNYTALVFFSSLFSYLFFRLIVFGERKYFPYVALVGVLAIYTNDIALMSLAAAAAAGVLARPTRANLLTAAKLGFILAVAWIPWAVVMPIQIVHSLAAVQMFKQSNLWPITEAPVGKFLALLNPYPSGLDGPGYGETYGGFIAVPADPLGWLGLSLAILAFGAILINLGRIVRNDSVRPFLFQIAIIVVFMALIPMPVFSQKTVYIFVFPLVLLLGYSLSELMQTRAKLFSIAFLVSFVAVSLCGFPHQNRGPDWKSLCADVTHAWAKARSPALLISPANEVLCLEYCISRGYLKPLNPVWMSLNLVVTLVPPFDRELKLNMVTEGNYLGWSLDEKALCSVVSRIQDAEPGTTDIFYLREGLGNLNLEWLNEKVVSWTASRKRFGSYALYHLERKIREAGHDG
jgi:hypothetical protein